MQWVGDREQQTEEGKWRIEKLVKDSSRGKHSEQGSDQLAIEQLESLTAIERKIIKGNRAEREEFRNRESEANNRHFQELKRGEIGVSDQVEERVRASPQAKSRKVVNKSELPAPQEERRDR